MIKLKDILNEAPRIPRKKGQHRGSSSHSDLYTDENPKGTIHGLKFATVKDAKASISKIKSSGKKHAHKVQAAVAMEQRAIAAKKRGAAAIYRIFINKMKKIPFVDQNTGDYNLKYNIQNLTEDFYLPVRGGDSGTNIENLSGLEFSNIEDIDYLKNKLFAALKIPKAYLGYEEQVNGKATLAAEDVRFARTIERIQRIIVSELSKIAIVHLYSQGITDADLTNYELSLVNPSFIYEQEKVNLWSEKIRLAQDIQGLNMLSKDWVYDNIFKLSKGESDKQRETMIEDLKDRFRFRSIEDEGSDPAKEEEEPVDVEESLENIKNELKNKGGRPREGNTYKKDKHPYGRDPLGDKERKNALKKETKFSPEKIKTIVNGVSSKRKFLKERDMLDESNIIEE